MVLFEIVLLSFLHRGGFGIAGGVGVVPVSSQCRVHLPDDFSVI